VSSAGRRTTISSSRGALALDGTLEANVAAGGFYGLFEYGSRSGDFADVEVTGTGGFTVASSSLEFGIPNQINLAVLGAGQTLQFWDGTDMTGNGTVDGGSGTWNAGNTNWTGAPGSADINGPWLGSVGVFMGAAGTVTVSGTQSFDTLQFKTDGYEVTGGMLAIAPATGSTGTLSVDGGVTVTIGSAIADSSGPSGLAKVGGGTAVLSGLNTYSGGTSITGGTLSVASDGNLGAASGRLSIGGGTLATTASFTSQRAVTLAGAAGIDVGFATTLTLAGTISGAGGLVKLDYGTLVLSGANTYEGGTLLADGIVEVASDGNLGAASGGLGFSGGMLATTASFASGRDVEVAGAGGFDVAAGTTLSLAGDMTGEGVLAKLGGGDLVLSGASEVEWNVQAGGLTADAALFTGDVSIAAGAGFTFDQKADAAYAGTLSGFGAFTKTGAAALSFTGDGSAFSGATTVAQGLLAVNGTLGGAVDVLTGGTLGGAGTVGPVSVASGGTVAPGNSPGTLNVAGDISFASGSTYAVEIAGSGASDLIAASGQAILEGGTVEVTALDPRASYVTGQSFTILTAEGGVDGSFDAAVSGTPFLAADLGGTGDSVIITIAVDQAFTAAALTPNQFATAAALDTLPQVGPTLGLYNALLFLPNYASARAAFDQLSGDVHASVQSLFIQDSVFTRRAVTDRLRAAFGGVGASGVPVVSYMPAAGETLAYAAPAGPGGTEAGIALKAVAAPAATEALALWATGYGAWTDMDGNANAAGLTSDTGGFLIGADAPIGAGWRLGVVGGYGYTSFDFDGRNASGSSDDWTVGAYAGNQWGALGLRTGLAYTWQDVESSRSVAFEGFADQLKADYDAGTFQAFGELGCRIETVFASFEPFAGLAYVSLDTNGFGEAGGAAALTASGSGMDTTFSTLGLRLAKEVTIGSLAATLRGTVGWQHAFGDVTPRATQAFLGSVPFTVTGVPLAEDAALIEAGLDLSLAEATTLGLAYAGQFGDGITQNSFNATLKVSF
jgi:outer membrane autotransporter protein